MLGTEGGLLARLLTPFEFGLGGPIGDGRQSMSWIGRDDLVRLIIHAMETTGLAGPLNATAPEPVSNAMFTSELARASHGPLSCGFRRHRSIFSPAISRTSYLLGGQRVIPAKAVASGFAFRHPTLRAALADILGARRTETTITLGAGQAAGAWSLTEN